MTQELAGRFELIRPLGEGGMGQVFLAFDPLARREVALKVLTPELARSADARLRFRTEFLTMRRLAHPRVVAAYDFGTLPDERLYLAMEVVPGPGLDEHLPLAPQVARSYLIQALEGLAFLHAGGMVHADLKPDNMRLDAAGDLKLMDLGLAVPVGSLPRAVQGTPLYLAPEAIRCDRLDGRSDLYALGAVFYHLLTGRPPFEDESAVALLQAHLHEAPVPLAERGVPVPPDLEALIGSLLAKSPQDRPASAAAALRMLGVEPAMAPVGLLPVPFVGRAAELETLVSLIGGELPACAVVTGPQGIGKSRLLQEVASRVQANGRTVVSAAAEPSGLPFGALQGLRRKLEALVRDPQTLGDVRRALDGAEDGLDPRAAFVARQAAWLDFFRAAAGTAPLVLVLDDWDGADEASRALLSTLPERLGPAFGAMVAATASAAATVELGPLSEVEVAELASRSLGLREVSPVFAAGLTERSGGSPLLVEALLGELVEHDAIPREGALYRTDKVDWARAQLPSGTEGWLQRRCLELSEDGRSLAQAFALLRRPYPLAEVGAWLSWDEERLVEAASDLHRKGFLAETEEGLRLAQPAMASVLLQGLSADELAMRHRAIATALEARGRAGDAPDLAHHLHAAGEGHRAVPFALSGAHLLLGRYALQEAERLLEAAEEVAGGDERSQLLELKGDLLRMRGDLSAAEGCYREALELRRGATARLETSLALVCQMRSRFEEALSLALAGAESAAREGQAAEGARAWTTVSRLHSLTGDMARAEEAAQRALELSRTSGARGFEAEALGLLGYFKVAEPGRAEEAIAYLQDALAIRQELGDRVGLNDAYMFLGNALMALGRYPEAHGTFERNLALCREIGAARNDEITALLNLAQVACELATLDSALERLDEALAMAEAAGDLFLRGYALALRGRVRAEVGQLPQALEDVQGAQALAVELESKYLALVAEAFHAQVLLSAGDRLGALESVRSALALSAETGIAEFDLVLWATQGEAYGQLGDRHRAGLALDRALTAAQECRSLGAVARVRLAQAAFAPGDAARERLSEARAALTEAGMQALGVRAMILEAHLLVREGRVHEGAHLYREAQVEAVRLGLTLLAAEAARGLAEWDPAEEAQLAWRAAEAALTRVHDSLPGELQESFRARYLRPVSVPEVPEAGRDRSMASVVADFGRMVTGTLSYREVLDRVIDQVMTLTRAERGMIMLVDPDGALSGLVVRPRLEGDASLMAFSRSFAETALRERRSIWVADAQSDARFAAAKSVMALDLRTVICVPLLVDEAVIGLLYLDQQSINRKFSEADLHLVEGLAGFAALAIANARRFEEAQERTKLLAAIQQLSRLVSAQVERAEIERVILAEALSVGRAAQGALLLGDPPVRVAAQGEPADATEFVLRARQTGRPATEVTAERVSRLALPLVAHHRVCGLLYLEREPLFTPAEVAVLEAIGAQAAIALDTLEWREQQLVRSSRLEKALQLIDDQRDATKVDELTGLFTPDYLSERLGQEIREAARYQQPLSLLVLDPARMGELNERFGTETGDAMLRQIAEELLGKCRKTDVLCRLGGDEFAIVMPQTPAAGAEIFSERLRRHLAELAICDDAGSELWSFEAAIAVVEWRASESPEAFLERGILALG